ncbi:MAG: hypothetical protein U9N14_06405, partial [Pseudomonadota bacterium]|nr:hypothetical protein [Pseudomonadota bacterium]
RQVKRNLLASLFTSQGVPMLLSGDELGNTQKGNNNTYCQDNELGWIDWTGKDEELTDFVSTLARIRRDHPQLRQTRFLPGARHDMTKGETGVRWLRSDGDRMHRADWQTPWAHSFGMSLETSRGRRRQSENVVLLFNAQEGNLDFQLPETKPGYRWQVMFDTARAEKGDATVIVGPDGSYPIKYWSMVMLKAVKDNTAPNFKYYQSKRPGPNGP